MPPSPLCIELVHPSRRVDTDALHRLLCRVLDAEGRPAAEVTVILTDHPTVLDLNRRYLRHDYHTDVLSFPLHESPDDPVVGEVYVDLDTAAERHAEFGAGFEEEVCRYAIHGLLHLLGYDDATPEARAEMRALEDRYLATTA